MMPAKHYFYAGATGLVLEEQKPIDIDMFLLFKAHHEQLEVRPLLEFNTVHQVGQITIQKYLRNAVFYHESNDLLGAGVINAMNSIQVTTARILSFLWFVKDCSCNIESTIYVDGEKPYCRIVRIFTIYSRADGIIGDTTFSFDDLKIANHYLTKYYKIKNDVKVDEESFGAIEGNYSPSLLNFVDYNKFTRIDKAIQFLDDARSADHMPAKIAFMVLLIETLFTVYSDSVEISYKIGHRVAAYLETDNTKRKDVFVAIGKFYNIRSRYLHGQGTPKKKSKTIFSRNDFAELSKEIDELCRRILKSVLEAPQPFLEENEDNFRVWLDSLYYKADDEIPI